MKEQIEDFYSALNNCDADRMIKNYHNEIVFSDPAFGLLKGTRAKNMWRMLCDNQKDKNFKVNLMNCYVTEDDATADWEAFYNFSKTGRDIHNTIHAEFQFKDGKIIKHSDYFNLQNWAKQAMGLKGMLLGSTAFFRKQIHKQTNKMLTAYEKANGLI